MAYEQKNIRISAEDNMKWLELEMRGYSLAQILRDGINKCYEELQAELRKENKD